MLLAFLLALLQPLLAQPDRFGLPACSAPDQELATRNAFVLCYSGSLKAPIWTVYELKARPAGVSVLRPKHFRHDYGLSVPSAYDSDYRNSGFSRGHMVPAADLAWNEDALSDSFLLSNAVPQDLSLNAGKWRMLEGAIRKLADTSDALIVLTGAIFSGTVERIGKNAVAVPSHIFKIVLAIRHDELEMFAFILPNGPNPSRPLSEFAAPAEEVQRRTGLEFFPMIPALLRQELESTVAPIEP